MDAQRELLCCMFAFDVPQTRHICYESVFGRDLGPQTFQHLQYLSMSNSQMKIILDSNSHCRYIRPVVEDFLKRLVGLQRSLKQAKEEGHGVRVSRVPEFEWTSAVEQKDCCNRTRTYKDNTITFQLVQTLFTLAVAGNANDAPRLLFDVLNIDEANFKDIVVEVKKRLLAAAGILEFIVNEILPNWTSRPGLDGRKRPVPLECCPKFLEALAFMFKAQAYQANVALTARNTTKKEVLARICIGITKRYEQALEALNTPDPNGVLLIDRIRPSLRVYLDSMQYIINGVAVVFLAEAALKSSSSSVSGSSSTGSSSSKSATASAANSADVSKACSLFLRAQDFTAVAQDLIFEARTWSLDFFDNTRCGPDASAFGSLFHGDKDSPATKPKAISGQPSAKRARRQKNKNKLTKAKASPPTQRKANSCSHCRCGRQCNCASTTGCSAVSDAASTIISSDSQSPSRTTKEFVKTLEKQGFALSELYCAVERDRRKLQKLVTESQLARWSKISLPNGVLFSEAPYVGLNSVVEFEMRAVGCQSCETLFNCPTLLRYALPEDLAPYSFLPWSTQQKAAKLHFYQAQHASQLPSMRKQGGDKFKMLKKEKCFQFTLPEQIHEGQVCHLSIALSKSH